MTPSRPQRFGRVDGSHPETDVADVAIRSQILVGDEDSPG
jgi:hypothetical protein